MGTVCRTGARRFGGYPGTRQVPNTLRMLAGVGDRKLAPVMMANSKRASLLSQLGRGFPNVFRTGLVIATFSIGCKGPGPRPCLVTLGGNNFGPGRTLMVRGTPLNMRTKITTNVFAVTIGAKPLRSGILLGRKTGLLFRSVPSFGGG